MAGRTDGVANQAKITRFRIEDRAWDSIKRPPALFAQSRDSLLEPAERFFAFFFVINPGGTQSDYILQTFYARDVFRSRRTGFQHGFVVRHKFHSRLRGQFLPRTCLRLFTESFEICQKCDRAR